VEKSYEITQGRIDHATKLTPRGDIASIYRVQFFVGDQGPFTQTFEEADFTPEKIKAAQDKVAATIRAL
jgi:hypothetical protein